MATVSHAGMQALFEWNCRKWFPSLSAISGKTLTSLRGCCCPSWAVHLKKISGSSAQAVNMSSYVRHYWHKNMRRYSLSVIYSDYECDLVSLTPHFCKCWREDDLNSRTRGRSTRRSCQRKIWSCCLKPSSNLLRQHTNSTLYFCAEDSQMLSCQQEILKNIKTLKHNNLPKMILCYLFS